MANTSLVRKRSTGDIWNIMIMVLLCAIMLYPFWQTVVASFMSESEYLTSRFKMIVTMPTLASYKQVFQDGTIFIHLRVTFLITVIGTAVALFMTAYSAYGLSKPFKGSKVVMFLIVMTMFMSAGLIPDYMNYKELGLINHFAVYILPYMINTFYLIIMRSTFMEFPKELEEAARIDGCNDFRIFFTIVLPLSKPILAAIGLFFMVSFWNTYMQSVFFITDKELKTVQEYLQKMITSTQDLESIMLVESGEEGFSAETIRFANIVMVLLPIITVYPFLQKFFVNGIMMGSLKG
ncbi:carbohydrate ABC transporter permease [Paenibacillus chondroitinus]|uniref:Carbohydrate ABC transporter permease n=1 Tax=Paenibacillus chondroitinus TaxID=59842 RepID=A0ABU6D5J7_9BACL|nr:MULTISPECIES: carbohydrate ABC transporter permease [Paenibacillus]MCY9660141.1 carbohydrate ABC transporter permease [Paenibacillus anseongense]MEB4793000.1 carbohydrate ABC transporter permease [Paenibacillus chondroitinus]